MCVCGVFSLLDSSNMLTLLRRIIRGIPARFAFLTLSCIRFRSFITLVLVCDTM
jgi:hypothetical protein